MQGLDLRDGVTGLVVLARRDLHALWQQVSDAAQAQTALHDILPALIDTYGAAAATLAADWYDEARAKADIAGRFTAIPADITETGVHALVGWATQTASDFTAFQSLIEGGTQRRIANFSRGTVMGSAVQDPKARGWQRVGDGECAFCAEIIARGNVYQSEDTATFGAHDHCMCSAVPAWGGRPVPVKPYTPSLKFRSDEARAAQNKRTREWLKGVGH